MIVLILLISIVLILYSVYNLIIILPLMLELNDFGYGALTGSLIFLLLGLIGLFVGLKLKYKGMK